VMVVVDRTRCSGIGICESIAPDFFEVGDDGALLLLREDFADGERSAIEDAVGSCPAAALSVVD